MIRILFSLVCCQIALAENDASLIERLIAEQWQPHEVNVAWSSSGALPISVAAQDAWTLDGALPKWPCGSLIVQLKHTNIDGTEQRVSISGICRVRVHALTVANHIPAGHVVTKADLVPAEIDWKPAFGEPLELSGLDSNAVAVRALIPGRPVTAADLKSAPIIRSGQRVSMQFEMGGVRVQLEGRALDSGAAGESIRAASLDLPRRIYNGCIQPDGHVQITL